MADNKDIDQYEEFDDLHDDVDGDFDEPHAEPPQGFMSNLSNAWHTNPGFKIGTIIVGGVALVGTAFALLDSGQKVDPSKIQSAANVSGTPGGENTPEVKRIIGEANDDRTKQAATTGTSAILTPEGAAKDQPAAQPAAQADPLAQWRAAEQQQAQQPTAPPQMAAQQPQQQPQQQQQQEQENTALTQMTTAMQTQMQTLLANWGPGSPTVIPFTQPSQNNGNAQSGQNGGGSIAATNISAVQPAAKVLQAAGEIKYGSLITEANSDIEGTPILAEVQSGPLKKARLIGQFEVREDYLVLHFTRVVYKGKEYPADVLALDPNTTLGGMATETDQRYFSRVVLPAAARFVQGLGSAIADSGTTTTIVGDTVVQSKPQQSTRQAAFSGLGEAAQSVGDFMQQQGAQIKPLVRVASGTPLGLFFVQSVTDQAVTPGVQPVATPATVPQAVPPSGTQYYNAPQTAAPANQGYYAQPTNAAPVPAPVTTQTTVPQNQTAPGQPVIQGTQP